MQQILHFFMLSCFRRPLVSPHPSVNRSNRQRECTLQFAKALIAPGGNFAASLYFARWRVDGTEMCLRPFVHSFYTLSVHHNTIIYIILSLRALHRKHHWRRDESERGQINKQMHTKAAHRQRKIKHILCAGAAGAIEFAN